jgi:hypothetical protein
MLSAEPATGLKCRIPADTDAAIRISQVLQLSSLVQVAQQQVHHLQPELFVQNCVRFTLHMPHVRSRSAES